MGYTWPNDVQESKVKGTRKKVGASVLQSKLTKKIFYAFYF